MNANANGNEGDDEVIERRFDWALREVAGGERAPDVVDAVLARVAAGETGEPADERIAAPAAARARWLAFAAVFLLGALTVLGVALLKREPARGDAPVDEAQQPAVEKLLEVTSPAAIASLPKDLKAVELRNQDDAAVAALAARCPSLEHLRIYASISSYRADDAPGVSITDAAFPVIGSLTKLRTLELLSVQGVEGNSMRELERLPLLEQLRLSYFDLDAEHLQFLPRLPSLRRLTMELNLRLDAAGLAAIAGCAGLRELVLSGSHGAPPEAWQPLARLQGLRSLDLSEVGCVTRGIANEEMAKRFPQFVPENPPENRIADESIKSLPELTALRIGASLVTADIGKQLRTWYPQLRDLDLARCDAIDDTTIADLVALPTLRVLRIRNCAKVGAAAIPLLAAAQQLRTVDFGTVVSSQHVNSPWLTIEHAEALLRSGKRVEWYPPADRRAAFAALCERYRSVFERCELVRSHMEFRELLDDVTRIEYRGVDNLVPFGLSRRKNLVALELVGDDPQDPVSGRSFTSLCSLPKLESLVLTNLRALRGADLVMLVGLRTLRSLSFSGVAVDDDVLEVLQDLPSLTELNLSSIRTFTAAGMKSVAGCSGLRRLGLAKCTQLDADALASLGALRHLEVLDLGENPGLRDRALMALQPCSAMRTLDLRDGRFTSMGLQAVTGMHALTDLHLGGNDEIVPSALLHVPTSVEVLHLDRCKGLDANAATLLRDRFPKLAELDVGQNDWVTDDVLRALVQCTSLQRLDLLRCLKLTNASFETIRAARNLRWVRVTGTACAGKEQIAQLRQERPELEVVGFVW